jgi:hypothetical protein
MLYGFGWPKTEPDARRLREIRENREREEKSRGKAKGKGGKKKGVGDTIVVETTAPTTATSKRMEGAPPPRRGKGGGVWGRGGKGGGRSGRSGKGTWVEGGGEEEREERVMDHRTVNRFIAPEEEREVRKRGKTRPSEFADGIATGAAAGFGKDSATPDCGLLRIRGSAFCDGRSGSANANSSASAREESVGSSGFEEGEGGALRRSKRYFGSRMMMTMM